jgi:PAS domain S-box-containing protein
MAQNIDYTLLFDTLPERYVVFGVDAPVFTMLAANQAYFSITNSTKEQVIGHSLFEVFPDTSEKALKTGKGELQESLERVIKTKQPDSTGIIRYDLADEKGVLQVRYWQATHYPLFKAKKMIGILQSTADVTELVESNEQLKLANLKLEEAMSAGLVGSWSWDVQKDIVTADKGLATLFGVTSEQALKGLPVETFINSIYEDDRPGVSKLIEETVAHGDTFETEYRTVDAHGTVRWVIARGRVERDAEGNATAFPGVMIDISSRKEAEAIIEKSEQRLRFMADTMPQLVWITDLTGYHEYYNKHWYEYTGTTEGETDGDLWNNLLHPSDQARARRVWRKSLETGEQYEVKYRLYHAASGVYRWVIGRALPFRDDDGNIIKWYGTLTDIDDSIKEIEKRKELEAALKLEKDRLESRVAERTSQLQLTNEGLRKEIKKRQSIEKKLREYGDELKRSNKELEEFAYVSSHDLQEPLRKIQAFGDLLVEEYGDSLGEGSEYLLRIQSSAHRMSTLIDDLLTFSRVASKPAESKPVDLNEVVKNTIADLDDRIRKEKGSVVIAPHLPTVYADETHMRQLFQNLISNALKFHAPERPPIVEVTATNTDEQCTITVKDNGIGIEDKYKQKVFAVFQRLNAKHAFEGTGIGLAVCRKIVERYNGTIEIESQLGIGTTFIITLPIVREAV